MKLVLRISIFLSISILGGCSWLVGEDGFFETSGYDYTKAKMTANMEVPESVGEANIQDNYLIPELGEVIGIIYGVDNEIMAPMQVLTLGDKARVNLKSEHASVFITASEIKLWDSIDRYLSEENIPISSKDLATSTIITGWNLKEDDSFWSDDIIAWRQRYKIVLSSAERPSEKIITIELLEDEEFVDDNDKWTSTVNPGRNETKFLNSILGFIYVEDISQSRKKVNQSALGGISLTLGSDALGNPALISKANYEHVWTRIPISLRLLNISVEDQDRSQGLYFIVIKDDVGFLDSLAFWSSGPETLEIKDGSYQIMVAKLGERVSITFFDDNNVALTAKMLADNFPALSKAFRSRVSE